MIYYKYTKHDSALGKIYFHQLIYSNKSKKYSVVIYEKIPFIKVMKSIINIINLIVGNRPILLIEIGPYFNVRNRHILLQEISLL